MNWNPYYQTVPVEELVGYITAGSHEQALANWYWRDTVKGTAILSMDWAEHIEDHVRRRFFYRALSFETAMNPESKEVRDLHFGGFRYLRTEGDTTIFMKIRKPEGEEE